MSICRLGPAGLLALTLVVHPASAQTPPLASPPPSATCVAPKIVERVSVPSDDISHLQQLANDYGRCMKAYIDARQSAAEAYSAGAKAEIDAGNAAAHQVNDLYMAVKAYAAKHAKD